MPSAAQSAPCLRSLSRRRSLLFGRSALAERNQRELHQVERQTIPLSIGRLARIEISHCFLLTTVHDVRVDGPGFH